MKGYAYYQGRVALDRLPIVTGGRRLCGRIITPGSRGKMSRSWSQLTVCISCIVPGPRFASRALSIILIRPPLQTSPSSLHPPPASCHSASLSNRSHSSHRPASGTMIPPRALLQPATDEGTTQCRSPSGVTTPPACRRVSLPHHWCCPLINATDSSTSWTGSCSVWVVIPLSEPFSCCPGCFVRMCSVCLRRTCGSFPHCCIRYSDVVERRDGVLSQVIERIVQT